MNDTTPNNHIHRDAYPEFPLGAHQTHIAAAVHQSNISSHQFRSHFLSGSAVFRTATLTGAAENADSFHAGILNLVSSAFMLRTLFVHGVPANGKATRTSLCYDHLSLPRARMAQSK
jgi:hypothetical protein